MNLTSDNIRGFCILLTTEVVPKISPNPNVVTHLVVSPDESRGYLGFSTVMPPQRFPFGRNNLKNILVRPIKFGVWVYMGNVTNAIVFLP